MSLTSLTGARMSVKARVSHRSTGTKLPMALQCWLGAAARGLCTGSTHSPAGLTGQARGERVVCFPTSLDARRLNLLAIWGGRDPQGSRRERNGGCSQHGNPLRNKGRQTRILLKYSQLCLRTLQKGEMLLINNALGTTEMMRLGFCTLSRADQIL